MNADIDKEGRYTPATSVIQELAQFKRLCAIDPPISCAELAHRMVWTKRDTRWMLNKIGDKRK